MPSILENRNGQRRYIKLYRRMMKWGWYTDTPTKCVFCTCFFWPVMSRVITGRSSWKPGKAVASIRQISTDTGISVQSVRTALSHLKSTQEITQCEHGKFSVFTVNNYSDYQCTNTESNKQVTQNQHSANTDPYIKNNKELRIPRVGGSRGLYKLDNADMIFHCQLL